VTDHGFIHWEPDADEIEDPPRGEILWRSRRAIVGRGLKHPTAVAAPVQGSDLECRVPRSVNAFRTYGGIGFFHGGATLQELVIPVVVFRWPKKAEKVAAVLTPISEIASLKCLDAATTVEQLNRQLRGWANYFCLGPVSKSYRALNAHTVQRLRRGLCAKHKISGNGKSHFPDQYLHEELGLVYLPALTRNLPWARA
jgi:hypothetical protein